MRRVLGAGLIAMGVAGAVESPLLAIRQAQAPAPGSKAAKVTACSLLTRDEVKKLAPWPALLDQFKTEEESIGASGSGCNYPSVLIQLLPFSPTWFETARKRGKLETLAGVGD